MIDRTKFPSQIISDDNYVFQDGTLYIISIPKDEHKKDTTSKPSIDILYLTEFDNPISLADIPKKYPDVRKMMFESYMSGEIFTYKNHSAQNAHDWELTGTTIGYV